MALTAGGSGCVRAAAGTLVTLLPVWGHPDWVALTTAQLRCPVTLGLIFSVFWDAVINAP